MILGIIYFITLVCDAFGFKQFIEIENERALEDCIVCEIIFELVIALLFLFYKMI